MVGLHRQLQAPPFLALFLFLNVGLNEIHNSVPGSEMDLLRPGPRPKLLACYGRNEMQLELKSPGQLVWEEMWHPYFVFQYFRCPRPFHLIPTLPSKAGGLKYVTIPLQIQCQCGMA